MPDPSVCVLVRGRARRVKLGSMRELADLIEGLASNEALSLGTLRSDLPDEVEITPRTSSPRSTALPVPISSHARGAT